MQRKIDFQLVQAGSLTSKCEKGVHLEILKINFNSAFPDPFATNFES